MLKWGFVLKEYFGKRLQLHFLIVFCSSVLVSVCYAKDTLQSSVSPEFPSGLHAKYLNYIASKLDVELVITPLTFARRIVELQNGNLDIVVGLSPVYTKETGFILLKPSYESLQNTIFIKNTDHQKISTLESFKQSTLAVTIGGTYFEHIDNNDWPALVKVSSLEQKIGLLEKDRVDGFIHFAPSTIKVLDTNNRIIIPAKFQTDSPQGYYFALSKKSKLMSRVAELEGIIARGKLNGDFKNIREQHYLPNKGNPQRSFK
ncbi:substrate-binding periplasmic protein [Aliiglaciecola lipolytica]|uniref:Solute-binding protein family 3/N-terminal domain-containing protein n=1 Tax=Aliiglaciecola lipolytica E3 TaxID=1127673 RepID=K6Y9E9_9ALTE|nr:transporter substrate-binding domain-containing protein [Aliiglaciecola lipolytica]GAC14797.1 hypothetical protein GLIP_2169 [Aliiglaciecola lipolytica E3]